jgi:hypothetical protein
VGACSSAARSADTRAAKRSSFRIETESGRAGLSVVRSEQNAFSKKMIHPKFRPRVEDDRLIRGQGRYIDDVDFPNLAFAVSCARLTHSHGLNRSTPRKRSQATA